MLRRPCAPLALALLALLRASAAGAGAIGGVGITGVLFFRLRWKMLMLALLALLVGKTLGPRSTRTLSSPAASPELMKPRSGRGHRARENSLLFSRGSSRFVAVFCSWRRAARPLPLLAASVFFFPTTTIMSATSSDDLYATLGVARDADAAAGSHPAARGLARSGWGG